MSWKTIDKKEVIKLLSADLNEIKLTNEHFLVNSSIPHDVSGLSDELFEVFNKIKSKGIQPLFIGESLFDTKNFKSIRLKLPFAYKISKEGLTKAYLKPKGEQLFLYGRDVISESVIKIEGEVKLSGLIFVLNQNNEFLGLGTSIGALTRRGKSIVIKHIIDIGHYLRCEKKKT